MKNLKLNSVNIAGNISQVNLRNGQHGTFGSVTIALDDGYFQKGQNGQDGQWVDRTQFIEVKVNANNLKSLKNQLQTGDQLQVEGKLVIEKWQDKNTQDNRSAMKVDCKTIVCHIPKAVIDAAKQAGVIKVGQNQNQNQNQSYQPQGNGQQRYMNSPNSNQNHAPNQSQGNGFHNQGYQQ